MEIVFVLISFTLHLISPLPTETTTELTCGHNVGAGILRAALCLFLTLSLCVSLHSM